MTMIGDMQFRSDHIEGTCARYFLFIEPAVIRNLCVSAHINCDKLREYARHADSMGAVEMSAVSDDSQTAFGFLNEEEPLTSRQVPSAPAQLPTQSDLVHGESLAKKNRACEKKCERTSHELQIRNLPAGRTGPGPSSVQRTSGREENQSSKRQS